MDVLEIETKYLAMALPILFLVFAFAVITTESLLRQELSFERIKKTSPQTSPVSPAKRQALRSVRV